ncbi:MAG: phospholipid carrier-dependent glycosyltransferase [Thermoflexia bacterium]|nr:MAG: phospholipid carrier-dependent glycosyltransferase [Thermoflexia bacterium]
MKRFPRPFSGIGFSRLSVWRRLLPYWLLFCFFAQVVLAGPRLSLTADEPVHMAQGYVYWTRMDWRFAWAVAQPPLPDALAGIGLLLQPGPVVEELEGWAGGDHSRFVSAFLHWYGPGRALEAATFVSRFPITLVALIGAAFVYRWARERFGRRGGWLALCPFAFDPNLLAHSGLATTDVLLTVWGFVGVYAATRWAATRSWKWGLLSGVVLGLALGSKTSGFFPLGIVGLLGFIWALEEFRQERGARVWFRWAGRLAALAALAALTLWALYGFELQPYPFATHLLLWRMLRKHVAEGHMAFLMGQVGHHGWWYYYPVAFLLKTPLPTLLLVGMAFLVPGYSLRRWWQNRDLWLHPLLYGIATLFSTIAIGYRYLLPVLPFLYILAGRATRSTEYGVRIPYSVLRIPYSVFRIPLLLWLALGTLRVFPHYLTFFNELAGGPYGGHRYLVDSNLDWGQSFKALRGWLQKHENGGTPYLSFYTYAGPDLYGIVYRPIPPAPYTPLALPSRFDPPPGLYVIGATTLQGVMLNDPDTYDWFRHREPIARPGIALFVYRVLPHDPQPTWLAQCTVPVAPLTPEAAADGFGRSDLRLAYFDCTSGWLYPTGGRDPGWFALFRPTALSDDPFVPRQLTSARLSFEQRRTGALPPFVIYEQEVGPLRPSLPSRALTRLGALTFLGHTVSGTPKPGQTVEIETWWRVEDVPARPLSVMMHLVGPEGEPVIVSDGLAVPVDQWRPGDIIVQRHRLSIPADAPSGEYQPYTGVYWLDTMERWPVEIDNKPAGDRIPLPVVKVSR